MSIENQVNQILFAAIEEINEQLPPDRKIGADKARCCSRREGVLDSLTLVKLIVATEQKVQETSISSLPLPMIGPCLRKTALLNRSGRWQATLSCL